MVSDEAVSNSIKNFGHVPQESTILQVVSTIIPGTIQLLITLLIYIYLPNHLWHIFDKHWHQTEPQCNEPLFSNSSFFSLCLFNHFVTLETITVCVIRQG